MWSIQNGRQLWSGGKEDFVQAAEEAERCGSFRADCEEERVACEDVSCYNCRYRRWTRESFACMKENKA